MRHRIIRRLPSASRVRTAALTGRLVVEQRGNVQALGLHRIGLL